MVIDLTQLLLGAGCIAAVLGSMFLNYREVKMRNDSPANAKQKAALLRLVKEMLHLDSLKKGTATSTQYKPFQRVTILIENSRVRVYLVKEISLVVEGEIICLEGPNTDGQIKFCHIKHATAKVREMIDSQIGYLAMEYLD